MILNTKNKLLLISLWMMFSVRAAAMDISLVFIGDTDNSAWLGAKQGLIEANLLGEFLGHSYRLDNISLADIHDQDFSGYSAVLSAVDSVYAYSAIARQLPDMAVFNLVLEDDSLRTQCIANALHTIPSRSMKQDAAKQWQQKQPDSKAVAQAWHPDFVKFAARDLNKRYKVSAERPMDDAAWAGWAAVKMTSDTVARINSGDAAKLMAYFKTSLRFDGQKGSDMNFRETGQLRQLMLLVENDKIVAEAPVRGVASSLDSLGLLTCKK